MPQKYILQILGDNERILHVTRQHWLVLIKATFIEIVLIILIAVVALSLSVFFPIVAGPVALVIALVLLIVPFLGGVVETLRWWNRQFIITNRRVLHVSGIFKKNVIDTTLTKVNDVKMEQSAVGRMFNYGNIKILTASELGKNPFRMVGDPIAFRRAMLNAKETMFEETTPSPGIPPTGS
jgi:uncharacterized membrane protein YdbT with pleckstrin-like domain